MRRLIEKRKRVLLVGACGMGVGPLGIFLSQMGHDVWAYDDYPVSLIVKRMRKHGIRFLDHLRRQEHFDEIVITRALACNPERIARLQQRFPTSNIIFRGDYISRLSSEFRTIAVVGSHGKTSTTANLVVQLQKLGITFSYILGGYFSEDKIAAANYSEIGDWLILEVDESDGTIEKFAPEGAIVTNVELDHVDYYESEARIVEVFREFVERTSEFVVLGSQVPRQLQLQESDWVGLGVKKTAVIAKRDQFWLENELLAQKTVELIAKAVPVDETVGSEPIGVERRQQITTISDNCVIIGDYAHHPSEIGALRTWVNEQFPDFEQHWVFQPHRYSRTAALLTEFAETLEPLNPILLPEYAAFEKPLEKGSSRALIEEIHRIGCNKEISLCKKITELWSVLENRIAAGRDHKHVILFVGAGDISVWKNWTVFKLADGNEYPSIEEFWVNHLQQQFHADGSVFSSHEPLKRKTTINVGGTSRYYAEPGSLESLQSVLKTSRMLGLPVRILGKGSNLLVPESGFHGVVVRLNQKLWTRCEYIGSGQFWVGGGYCCKMMSRKALEQKVAGFNFLDGIPGSIGGALRMNAGAMNSDMSEHILEAECLTMDGQRVLLSNDELAFSYRNCETAKDLIVLNVLLQGVQMDDNAQLAEELEGFRARRKSTQPAQPSAGCMFKNPPGNAAGRLIDEAGLKGYTIGGATVSEKHANFLVTSKGASADDVLALLEHVRGEVQEKFGVELEQEIQKFEVVDL